MKTISRKDIEKKVFEILSKLPDLDTWSIGEKGHLANASTRYSFILEGILKNKEIAEKTKILDVGCGEGHLAVIFRELFGSEVFALDLVDNAKWRLEQYGVRFYKQDFLSAPLPFKDNAFDLIIFSDVIEHLTSGQYFIFRELYRVLNYSGIAFIGTPNLLSFPKRLKFFFGSSPLTPFRETLFQDHIHEYSMKELAELSESVHFKIVDSRIPNTLYKYLRRNILIKYLYKTVTIFSESLGDYLMIFAEKHK